MGVKFTKKKNCPRGGKVGGKNCHGRGGKKSLFLSKGVRKYPFLSEGGGVSKFPPPPPFLME